jgi:Trypsin-like peptidase domain
MHATTLHNPFSITCLALLSTGLGLGIPSGNVADPAVAAAPDPVVSVVAARFAPASIVPVQAASRAPRRIAGDVADVLVRIRGGAVCSGTPISATRFVVTAAHCVLDRDGSVASRTVVRDGVEYRAAAVLVDARYHDTPAAVLDAAVLVMSGPIPGPSATLGTRMPSAGGVTLAGFQPIDSDGSLLRGSNPHDLPVPAAAKHGRGGVFEIETAPAGCHNDVTSIEVTEAWVRVPCGLIPGASGGGLFSTHGDRVELVGIVSTVSADITHNGVVPMASLLELLEHQGDYLHVPGQDWQPVTNVQVSRS